MRVIKIFLDYEWIAFFFLASRVSNHSSGVGSEDTGDIYELAPFVNVLVFLGASRDAGGFLSTSAAPCEPNSLAERSIAERTALCVKSIS